MRKLIRLARKLIGQPAPLPQIAYRCNNCSRWYSPYVAVLVSVGPGEPAVSASHKDDGHMCKACATNVCEFEVRYKIHKADAIHLMGIRPSVITIEKPP